MIKRILRNKKLLLVLVAVVAVLTLAHPMHGVSADSVSDACKGVGLSAGTKGCSSPGVSINDVIKSVVNIISGIVGVVAVIMIIVGGFKYITSGGDANNVSSAKNTIVYAIVGLVVVALAQLLVHFVIKTAAT